MAIVKWRVGKEGMVEVEGADVKAVVAELSEFLEFFQQDQCGLCGCQDLVPGHRTPKGYDFFSMKCTKCGAELSFGQTKEGGKLFAKRTLEDGSWDRDHQGWKPPYKKAEQPAQIQTEAGW